MASHDTEHARRDSLPLLLGVITIIGGVATGLFSDLRSDGKILGVVVFLLWAWIIGRVLWNPELTPAVRRLTSVVLALTVEGAHNLNTACPGAADGQRAAAEVALGQLQSQFVHVTLKNGYCAGDDVRLRTGDLLTVAPQ